MFYYLVKSFFLHECDKFIGLFDASLLVIQCFIKKVESSTVTVHCTGGCAVDEMESCSGFVHWSVISARHAVASAAASNTTTNTVRRWHGLSESVRCGDAADDAAVVVVAFVIGTWVGPATISEFKKQHMGEIVLCILFIIFF